MFGPPGRESVGKPPDTASRRILFQPLTATETSAISRHPEPRHRSTLPWGQTIRRRQTESETRTRRETYARGFLGVRKGEGAAMVRMACIGELSGPSLRPLRCQRLASPARTAHGRHSGSNLSWGCRLNASWHLISVSLGCRILLGRPWLGGEMESIGVSTVKLWAWRSRLGQADWTCYWYLAGVFRPRSTPANPRGGATLVPRHPGYHPPQGETRSRGSPGPDPAGIALRGSRSSVILACAQFAITRGVGLEGPSFWHLS